MARLVQKSCLSFLQTSANQPTLQIAVRSGIAVVCPRVWRVGSACPDSCFGNKALDVCL